MSFHIMVVSVLSLSGLVICVLMIRYFYTHLLDYRTTPLDGVNASPAQLLMGRRPRNQLTASKEVLQPKTQKWLRNTSISKKQREKFYYYHMRWVKVQSESPVVIKHPHSKVWSPGTVVKHYDVDSSNNRLYHRNLKHLKVSTPSITKQLENRYEASEQLGHELRTTFGSGAEKQAPPPGLPIPVIPMSDASDSRDVHPTSPYPRVTWSGRLVIPKKLDL